MVTVLGKLIEPTQTINVLGSIPPAAGEEPGGGGIVAFDNFNRSDRSLDGDTCSDGVNSWTNDSGDSWVISSNQARGGGGSYGRTIIYSFTPVSTMTLKVTVKATYYSSSVLAVGRYIDASNYYALYFYHNKVQIREEVGGSVSTLGAQYAVSADDVVELVIDGDDLTLIINDVEKTNQTGSGLTGGGNAGFWGSNNVWQFDDFTVTVPE